MISDGIIEYNQPFTFEEIPIGCGFHFEDNRGLGWYASVQGT